MKALTIRNVDRRLSRALEREKRRRGTSMNQTVLELLHTALGIEEHGTRSNGLRRLAGTWSAESLAQFEAATVVFEQVDAELWS